MSITPIYVFAKWQVKKGSLETVLSLLAGVAQKSREEAGNLLYKVHQSNADTNTLMLYEGYASEAAVDEHRNSKYFQDIVVGQIVPLLESREVILTTAVSE